MWYNSRRKPFHRENPKRCPPKISIHNAVKNALIKDGWKITDDPYHIAYKDINLYADLGAERPGAEEHKADIIVVEIKSFVNRSLMNDFENAVGQYQIYHGYLKLLKSEHQLYLAVSAEIYARFFERSSTQDIVQMYGLNILVVNTDNEEVEKWIEQPNTPL